MSVGGAWINVSVGIPKILVIIGITALSTASEERSSQSQVLHNHCVFRMQVTNLLNVCLLLLLCVSASKQRNTHVKGCQVGILRLTLVAYSKCRIHS